MRSILAVAVILFCLVSPITADSRDITGIWKGAIPTPVVDIEIYWRITRHDDGRLVALYDCPAYAIKDVPVPTVRVDDDCVELAVEMFPASWSGRFTTDPDTLAGAFRAAVNPIPMPLCRVRDDPGAPLPHLVPRIDADGRPVSTASLRRPDARPDEWPVAPPAEAGLDEKRLGQLLDGIAGGRYPNLHALLVARHGQLVVEEYFYGADVDTPHPIFSNAKGVHSALFGIAIECGDIAGIDTPVSTFFPEHSDLFADDAKRELTLEHFLTMTAGLEWNEVSTSYYDDENSNRRMQQSDDPVGFVLGRPLSHPPGTRFTYNSGLTVVLAEILHRATGTFPWLYAEERLFKPLGFHHYFWDTNPDGSAGGLFLRPRDFLELARLYLDHGRHGDRSVIPEAWFDNCYKPTRECDDPEYWNHWGRGMLFVDGVPVVMYSGGGFGGQAIFGFPDLDLVVAMTGGNFFTPSVEQHEILRDFILRPIVGAGSGYVPPDPAARPGVTALAGLEWRPTFFTGVGALWGAMDYLDVDVDEPWVYAITGHAFLVNAHERMYANCLGRWNNRRFDELTAAAGVEIQSFAAHRSQPTFESTRAAAWDAVRAAIDDGRPAYGFHMNLPEVYVVYGYDDDGYYYKGVDCRTGYGPRCRDQVAARDPGWFEMRTVDPCDPLPRADAAVAALRYALELNRSPERFQQNGYTVGPAAYEIWQRILDSGDADAFGVAYTAAGWATCRRNAAAFLGHARALLPADCDQPLASAETHYRTASNRWNEVSDLFPYADTSRPDRTANWRDADRRARAAVLLRDAAGAEKLGLDAIEDALHRIDVPARSDSQG